MGQSSEATNISAIISMSNTVGRNDRSGYTQKALAQIRNSLLPFANETGSTLSSSATTSSTSSSSLTRAGLENNNKELIQQHWVQRLAAMGYAEEAIVRAVKVTGGRSIEAALDWLHKQEQCELQQRPDPINSLARASGPGFSVLTTNVVRKPSFERDFHRASPALDSSNASTRSDSPGLASLSGLAALTAPVRGYVAPEPPPHTAYSHPHLSRTYSPSTLALPPSNESPPPPAPPPRGTTPPPPPLPPPPSAAAMASVHHLLKRMSPVPRSASSLSSGPQSAPPTPTSNGPPPAQPPPPPLPTRGNSPAPALPARPPPLIVHNGPQAQAQFSQQMQALNLNSNAAMSSTSATNPEPPPPYPVGSNKLTTPPPSYHASAAFSRQSPTFSCSPSPTMMGGQPPPIRSWTQSASISAASVSNKPMKTPPPPPVIMQSVKSTQVQKPVLQTAVAPTAPPPTTSLSSTNHTPSPPPPPPPYSSSGYGSACPSPFTSPSPLSFASNISPAPPSGSPAPPPVPTTDPPSYASTMQALAAQRSMQTTAPTLFPSTMNAFGKLPLDAINARKRVSPVSMAGLTVNVGLASAHGAATVGLEDRSGVDSPSMSVMGDTRPGPSHSPGSVTSSIPGSEATQDSGLGMGPSSVGKPEDNKDLETPPPPPPPYKLTHQSPIPERKFVSREKDEERRETKLRNYSPQAFKFYMEQHVENLMKSHQQRMHRRLQLETEMVKIGLSEEAQYQMRKMLSQKESNYIRLKRAKMDKSMFTKIRAIGVGAFGEVALVRKIDTNHLYAMKTLRKTDVLKRNQVAHVKAERDILAEADNEWVVKLYYSFQDKDNLYFVMDYIPGGDLMSLLIKFGIFEEPLARFYIAELVCAVESVHKMGFIHRDIKPDNILIDRDGHIKLTDFGLCTGFRWTHNSKYYQRNGDHARQDSFDPGEDWTNECRCQCNPALGNSNNLNGNNGTNAGNTCPLTPHPATTPITVLKPLERRRRREHLRCLAHSLVGTPNYIAPEVLMRTGYTQQCDWWSVGVILYEMLVGQPPFLANTPAETQYKVINWEHTLRIPKQANLSQEAADLILRLCTSSEQRLGRGGATELKSHGFFAGVDFEGGLRHQQAPYIPKIRFATDTSNFDPIDPDKLRNSSGGEADKLDNTLDNGKHPVHAFFEFTFRRFFDDGGHAYPVQRISVDDNENQGPVYV